MDAARDVLVLGAAKPISAFRRDDDRTSLAVAGGALAAVVGGLARAAVVTMTGYEIGWVARGARLMVGGVMGHITIDRGRGLALTAYRVMAPNEADEASANV